ncbi:MAG: VWA domain-containing protein [Cyanobacteria bacterium SZAS-4]|nr:VWA domain-containing protein [Cyanobacteria bacterium SZAS-4]
MNQLTFATPGALAAGLPLVILTLVIYHFNFRSRRRAREQYGEQRLIDRFSPRLSLARERFLALSWCAVVTLLVFAAAGPSVPDAPIQASSGALQVVIVSDVSNSMRAEDYRDQMPPKDGLPANLVQSAYGSRLDMVKSVIINQIMPAIAGNKMGLATYKGNGFQQANLTTDFTALQWVMVHWFTVGDAPGEGSNVAAGLSTALAIFDKDATSNEQRVIVLFSDGGFTDEPQALVDIAQQIKERGIRLVVVGVGSAAPQRVPFWSEGEPHYAVDENGKPIMVALNEQALRQLSTMMNGQFIQITAGLLDESWAVQLAGSHTVQERANLFYIPVALALMLIAIIRLRGLSVRRG